MMKILENCKEISCRNLCLPHELGHSQCLYLASSQTRYVVHLCLTSLTSKMGILTHHFRGEEYIN
jgi:hypothetical protein